MWVDDLRIDKSLCLCTHIILRYVEDVWCVLFSKPPPKQETQLPVARAPIWRGRPMPVTPVSWQPWFYKERRKKENWIQFTSCMKQSDIVHRGWQNLIPHKDKVHVITPTNTLFKGVANFDTSWRYSFFLTTTNILFRKGGAWWSLMKIKLMLWPQSAYCS